MVLRDITERLGSTQLTRVRAADFLHGALRVEDGRDGFVRPWRFSEQQMRAFGSCMAWHPGLYRQMGRTTAGVCVEFSTDSSEVGLEVSLDREPAGTRAVLDYVDDRSGSRPHDGVSCEVDGRMLGVRLPDDDGLVTFLIDDPDEAPEEGMVQLPGMGEVRHVRLWLPALRGCRVRYLAGNGTFVEPVPKRRQLLVVGDSIAQGFVTEDPGLSFPARLARELGLDLVNQGLGGQVFQPGSLLGVAAVTDPERIVVELGANYRYEPCQRRAVTVDIRSTLLEISRIWPGVPTWVLTPLWHDEGAWPSNGLSCWREVPTFLRAHTAPHDQMVLVDGQDLLDHEASLMADGYEHPNAEGTAQLSSRLAAVMCERRGSAEERRQRALGLLEGAPQRALPLAEALRRGLGEVTYAEEGCVLLQLPSGLAMLWGQDVPRTRDAIRCLLRADVVDCLSPELAGFVGQACGLARVEPYHVCAYEGSRRQGAPAAGKGGRRRHRFRTLGLEECVAGRDIRPLDAGWLQAVLERCPRAEQASEAEVRALLDDGRILGGFEDGELVGFVGERAQGSMGMLEVLPDCRRKGWGLALEAAKVSAELDLGHVPWCEVRPGDEAAARIQRRLGLVALPAEGACFLSRGE